MAITISCGGRLILRGALFVLVVIIALLVVVPGTSRAEGFFVGEPFPLGASSPLPIALASDGTNFLAVVVEENPDSLFDLYGVRITPQGTVLDPVPFVITDAAGHQWYPSVLFDGVNYVVVWEDYREGAYGHLYGARISPEGVVLDPGGRLLAAPAPDHHLREPSITWNGERLLLVWQDVISYSFPYYPYSRSDEEIHGMFLFPSLDPSEPSFPIQHETNVGVLNRNPHVASNGIDFRVVWFRNPGPCVICYDTFAGALTKTVNPDGTVPVYPTRLDFECNFCAPVLTTDGTHYLVALEFHYSTWPYSPRIQGAILGVRDNFLISDGGYWKGEPQLAFDGEQYLVVWSDLPGTASSNDEIIAGRVSPAGEVGEIIPIATTGARELNPTVVCNGTRCLVTWIQYVTGLPLFGQVLNMHPNEAPDLSLGGVDPGQGTVDTTFTHKVVYTDADNDAPDGGAPQVFVDGTPHAMNLDAGVTDAALRDGDYSNGEQYVYSTTLPEGAHAYHFEASDGTDLVRLPASGELEGPTVTKRPVILIPGITGSFLNKRDLINSEVWPNPYLMIPSPEDTYLNDLILPANGIPLDDYIYPRDVIRRIDVGPKNFSLYFEPLIVDALASAGYLENETLFVFPYDWRLDNRDSVSKLQTKIGEVIAQTSASKVDIITHSMGGLVAKQYTEQYGGDKIGKLIFIGTPHLGSPKAIKFLMYGDDFGIGKHFGVQILNPLRVKEISQNMPAVYQLLPSSRYLITDPNDPDYAQYNYYLADRFDLDGNGVRGRLSYEQAMQFMANMGRNPTLLEDNEPFHQDLDTWDGNAFGIKTYNVVGCTEGTIGKIVALNREELGVEYALHYVTGDGTVPLRSAETVAADQTYYVANGEHGSLPSKTGVLALVRALLTGETVNLPDPAYQDIYSSPATCALNGTVVSVHSPVALHIFDETGNHLGPNENGEVEFGIPGASYDVLDGNTFAFLPPGSEYRVVLDGTGEGTFNLRVQRIVDDEVTETKLFYQLPVTPDLTGELDISSDPTVSWTLQLDTNGDGTFEAETQPTSTLNTQESLDEEAPATDLSLLGVEGTNGWYRSDVQVTLTAADNEAGSGVLRTEYRLNDEPTWMLYQGSFSITQEGTTTLHYRSVDRSGNREEEQLATIRIDKAPPEATLSFDTELLALSISGIDNLGGPVAVTPVPSGYRLTDEAGNTLLVSIEERRQGNSLHAEITGLLYNGGEKVYLPKNSLKYEWSWGPRRSLRILEQKLDAQELFKVHALYDARRNETAISERVRGEEKKKQTRPGLVLLRLVTRTDILAFEY